VTPGCSNCAEDSRELEVELCGEIRLLALDCAERRVLRNLLDTGFGAPSSVYYEREDAIYLRGMMVVNTVGVVMKTLDLKPEDFPITVRLQSPEGIKSYLLVKTKQGKLLLNRPIEATGDKK